MLKKNICRIRNNANATIPFLLIPRLKWCDQLSSLVVRLAHVVAAGTEPLKQEDGPGRGLDCHHHHQHPGGEILEIVMRSRKHNTPTYKGLKEGCSWYNSCPLGHENCYSSLKKWNWEVYYILSENKLGVKIRDTACQEKIIIGNFKANIFYYWEGYKIDNFEGRRER